MKRRIRDANQTISVDGSGLNPLQTRGSGDFDSPMTVFRSSLRSSLSSRGFLLGFAIWAVLFVFPEAKAAVDSNGNGIDDVWELIYDVRGAVPGEDEDGDTVSNQDEADAGTNPSDPNDFLRIESLVKSGSTVTIQFRSQKGKLYRLYRSGTTVNPDWQPEGGDIVGDGTLMTITVTGMTSPENYFRLGVNDQDSDNDNLSDWAEEQLEGFDPDSDFSVDPNTPDSEMFLVVFQYADGPVSITATVVEAEAYEVFGTEGAKQNGRVRIRRVGGGLAPVTVFYTLEGGAPASQYSARDEGGNDPGGFLTVAQGQVDRYIDIIPVTDTVAEYPMDVVVTVDPHPDYNLGAETSAAVQIFDANDIPEHRQLFYGQLGPERGAVTNASGYATLRLNGKRTRALVDLSFSGLTSMQTAAHIHQSRDNGSGGITNGPVMESLPLGIIDDHVWDIPENGSGANSAQDLIDALYGQNGKLPLYANAHTSNYGGGEVWAFFSPYDSSDFDPPADPPALDPLDAVETKRDVVRFLTQATFGAKEEEVDALYDSIVNDHGGDRIAAYSEWIDDQFAEVDTKFKDLNQALDTQEYSLNGNTPNNGNPQPFNAHHVASWYTIARNGKDQLRKRVAFALSQILVISEENATVRGRSYGASSYFDMLSENADDSYRESLVDVSKHPLMGKYLTHLQNRKAVYDGNGNLVTAPDENYAREVMQLFSIGLVMLNPDGSLQLDENGEPVPTYNNGDITEMARVFTGWSFSKKIGSRNSGFPTENNNSFSYYGGPRYFEAPWEYPMKNFNSYHDTQPKNVLGVSMPGGRNGEQDLQAAIDILFEHQNTAPFIARRLIQRLVASNPSSGYIYRVSQAFENNNGNLKEVVRAILLDYEARELGLIDNIGYGKQKEPVIRFLQMMRGLKGASQLPVSDLTAHGLSAAQLAGYEPGATQFRMYDMTTNFGQSPHDAPSVFNWFLPDYILGGELAQNGLVVPEFTITSESQVVNSVNIFNTSVHGSLGMYGRPMYGQPGSAVEHRMILPIPDIMAELTAAVTTAPGADSTEKELHAVGVVLDKYDLILCSGALKAKYGGLTGTNNPRGAILEACEKVWYSTDDTPTSTDLREAARQLIYLITTSPDYLIQR